MKTCPDCRGTGRRTHPGDGGGFGGENCSRCEGSGMIASVITHHGKPPIIAQVSEGWKPRILPAGPEPRPIFVGIRKTVMQGDKCVGVMCSKTMAKRTANALNRHKPNREGV